MRGIYILFLSILFSSNLLAASGMQSISPSDLESAMENGQQAYLDKDYQSAFKHYGQAAQWGDKKAQYIVGQFYKRGLGVEKNLINAYGWLATAAEAPVTDYRNDAKSVLKKLDDQDRDRARERALSLQTQFGMDAMGIACEKTARTGSNIREVVCKHKRQTASGKILIPDAGDMAISF